MRYFIVLSLLFSILPYLGCLNQSEAVPTPIVIATDGGTPTVAPQPSMSPSVPTAIPLPVPPTPTPPPVVDIEATITARVEAALEARERLSTPEPAPKPTVTLQPTPTPTREPMVRPVAPPLATQSILRVSSISIKDKRLALTGTIEGGNYSPDTLQVWHSQEQAAHSRDCSTDRPIAFVRSGNGSTVYAGQVTPYTWHFCRGGYSLGAFTDPVPWLYSQSWSYELRKRIRITDPYIYDFSASVSLDHPLVRDLEYSPDVAAGWRVIVFSGQTLILNQWVEK